MGLVTFAIRFSLIGLADRLTLSERVKRGLKFVPIAVLSAIIFPDIFVRDNQIVTALNNPYLLSGLAAVLTAALTKNVIATMAVGLAIIWILT